MARCMECVYSTPLGNMKYSCSKTGRRFNYATSDPEACSEFRDSHDGLHSCYECEYYSKGLFGGYVCDRTHKKVNGDDRACSRFIEI